MQETILLSNKITDLLIILVMNFQLPLGFSGGSGFTNGSNTFQLVCLQVTVGST